MIQQKKTVEEQRKKQVDTGHSFSSVMADIKRRGEEEEAKRQAQLRQSAIASEENDEIC